MTVVAIDDTDSREGGMCTTYIAHLIATRFRERGVSVQRLLLIRLNPAVPYKTRGNAAVAVHADIDPAEGLAVAREVVQENAQTGDERTNPGIVVCAQSTAPPPVKTFSQRAVIREVDPADARSLVSTHGFLTETWGTGRGIVGALAAAGAWSAREEWTIERIDYRTPDRRGTDRVVNAESVFEAADKAYPIVWDTVDREAGEVVCVPNTPGPVLYGIRGDEPTSVRQVADAIESEPVEGTAKFLTNQGTDAHLVDGRIEIAEDGQSYRIDGTVQTAPETHEGGHVFLTITDEEFQLSCVAFEPTKRFREHVRALRPGDRITACGEVANGTLKLEKFAVRELVTTERAPPICPRCERSMESAGADQGYRCRDCGTEKDERRTRTVERAIEIGWYEVPPRARRHIAKPLIRGGFDGPTHPER